MWRGVVWCGAQVVLASLVRTLAGLRASSSSLVDALVGSKRDRRSSIPLSRGIAESLNKVRVVCNVWLRVGGQRWVVVGVDLGESRVACVFVLTPKCQSYK